MKRPELPVMNKPEDSVAPADSEAVAGRSKSPINKRNLILTGLAIGAIGAGVFGFNWWQYASIHEETDNATLVGHLHPVSARINGTVLSVLVRDNQLVKAGQPLVKLDSRDYQIKLQQAQAALVVARRQAGTAYTGITYARSKASAQTAQARGGIGAAQASIAATRAGLSEAKAAVPAAQATLAQAEANLTRADLDYKRYVNLEKEGVASKQQLETVQANYRVAVAGRAAAAQGVAQAQARVAGAVENIANAQAKLQQSQGILQDAEASGVQTDVNRAQFEAARAEVAQAEASLADAKLQLSYTTIVAPSAGRVGRRTVEAGQRLQPGQPLLSIVEDQVWVVANFKETQLAHMRPHQPVEVKVDAFGGHSFTGRIDSLSPASGAEFALLPPDNATGNFTKIVQRVPVKIVLDQKSVGSYRKLLTPGMSVTASVAVK